MTLDELKLQVEKDLKIDDERLDTESYKNQELYAKYLETVIKYIDGVLKSIQSRGWDIKNAISWKQFEAGMV